MNTCISKQIAQLIEVWCCWRFISTVFQSLIADTEMYLHSTWNLYKRGEGKKDIEINLWTQTSCDSVRKRQRNQNMEGNFLPFIKNWVIYRHTLALPQNHQEWTSRVDRESKKNVWTETPQCKNQKDKYLQQTPGVKKPNGETNFTMKSITSTSMKKVVHIEQITKPRVTITTTKTSDSLPSELSCLAEDRLLAAGETTESTKTKKEDFSIQRKKKKRSVAATDWKSSNQCFKIGKLEIQWMQWFHC